MYIYIIWNGYARYSLLVHVIASCDTPAYDYFLSLLLLIRTLIGGCWCYKSYSSWSVTNRTRGSKNSPANSRRIPEFIVIISRAIKTRENFSRTFSDRFVAREPVETHRFRNRAWKTEHEGDRYRAHHLPRDRSGEILFISANRKRKSLFFFNVTQSVQYIYIF